MACHRLMEIAWKLEEIDQTKENRVNPFLPTPCSLWTCTRSQHLALPSPHTGWRGSTSGACGGRTCLCSGNRKPMMA